MADGTGRWRPCLLAAGADLEPDGAVAVEERPTEEVVIGFAPTKGDRPEWALAKLTELGADRVVPLVAERSIVRWSEDRWEHHHAKWRRIVREAAMQSRRVFLPFVERPRPVPEVVAALEGVALAVPGGPPPTPKLRAVLVGPEGGWTTEEEALAPAVGLGPTVLRTETAVLASATLCVAARAGLVGKIGPLKGDHA